MHEANLKSERRIAFPKNASIELKESVRIALTNPWQRNRWITYSGANELLEWCQQSEFTRDNSVEAAMKDRKKRVTATTTTTTATGNFPKKAKSIEEVNL